MVCPALYASSKRPQYRAFFTSLCLLVVLFTVKTVRKLEVEVSQDANDHGKKVGQSDSRRSMLPPYQGPQRVFEPWDFERHPFPCYPAEEEWYLSRVVRSPTREGLLYVREMKTGSSTLAGIALRIAHRKAVNAPDMGKSELCKVRFDHSRARDMKYRERDKARSFLWSFIRDPTKRAISEFFHFEVSRNKVEPSDENFQKYLSTRPYLDNYFLRDLSVREYDPQRDLYDWAVHRILDDYNFIGLTERMDESLVVLQMILGLKTSDILYLPAKMNGGFDDGAYIEKCFFIVPKYVSPGMKKFFASELWQNRTRGDNLLLKAVNQSLDLTIDRLGRAEFEAKLERYHHTQRVAEERCASAAIYPCSPSGERGSIVFPSKGLPGGNTSTNCYWWDSGCGYACLDELSKDLDRLPE